MLNRSKVIRGLNALGGKLFVDFSHEYAVARRIWEQVGNDPTLSYKIRALESPWLLPTWEGVLNTVIPVLPLQNYTAVSVDGSQIYPDKHQGTPCYLINIGEVVITYGQTYRPVYLNSEPYLFTGQDQDAVESVVELVNCQRQEYEFKAGFEKSKEVCSGHPDPFAFLFDGSLIFWHLDIKESGIRNYLDRYLTLLDQFYQDRILVAGYISLSKSKEVSNILRAVIADFNSEHVEKAHCIDHVIDTAVVEFFLPPQSRSIVFKNTSCIVKEYPEQLQPYFFYLHVGNEIGRVEIPAWIAHDEKHVDVVAALILDQAGKGDGYPVVLAEAHEQAVVKGPDREFFYHLITKTALEQKRSITKSQKSIKKRGIRI